MDSNNMPAGTPEKHNNQVNEEAMEVEAANAVAQIINTADSPNGKIVTGDTPAKKSSGKGMMIAVALLALVAAGGIGFGVWAMMDGNNQKDELEKNYKSKISLLEQQNEKLTEELNGVNKDSGGDTIIDIDTDSDVNPEDYIYVGEWGMKIKIPENLDKVSYIFKQYGDAAGGGAGLVVSGVRGYDGRLPGFADLNENASGLGYVYRVLAGQECGSGSTKVISSDGYDYCYSHPQVLFSIEDELTGLETESTALVTSMLNNAENYSAI